VILMAGGGVGGGGGGGRGTGWGGFPWDPVSRLGWEGWG